MIENKQKEIATEEMIGKAIGDKPGVSWAIMNAEETAYCISFDFERMANEWLVDKKRESPAYIERNGYHVVRCEEWPDYLGKDGNSSAACKFINFAFKGGHFEKAENFEKLTELVKSGKSVQQSVYEVMFSAENVQLDNNGIKI